MTDGSGAAVLPASERPGPDSGRPLAAPVATGLAAGPPRTRRSRLRVVEEPAPAAAQRKHDVEGARELALRALSRRSCSRHELLTTLDRHGFHPDAAQQALARLERVGLVDDEQLARDVLRRASDKAGPALVAALRRRGIDRATAERVASEAVVDPAAALEVLRRRWASLRALPEPVALRRAQGLLARRGFDPALAAELLAALRGGG